MDRPTALSQFPMAPRSRDRGSGTCGAGRVCGREAGTRWRPYTNHSEPEWIVLLHSLNSRWRHGLAQCEWLRDAIAGASATQHGDYRGGTDQPWLGPDGNPAVVTRRPNA